MYNYHDSTTRTGRLAEGRCRCDSPDIDTVFPIDSLIDNRRVLDPFNREEYLTSVAAPKYGEDVADLPPRFIYAVGLDYTVHIAMDGDRSIPGSVKHETLFHNKNVLAAGEIGFTEGVITSINDHSGSYSTYTHIDITQSFVDALLQAFPAHTIEMLPILRSQLEDKR
jgi:hypothetical protein